MTMLEAAELLGVSKRSITNYIDKGLISAKKVQSNHGCGYAWDIEDETVYALLESRGEERPEAPPQKEQPGSKASGKTSSRGHDITRGEAERLLKYEQMKSARYKNMQLEKRLVDAEELKSGIAAVFTSTWGRQREFIEQWAIDFNLTFGQVDRMQKDFDKALKAGNEELARKVDNARG